MSNSCNVSYKEDVPSGFLYTGENTLVVHIVFYLITIACCFGNVTVIVAIAKNRRLHTITNTFIVWLAFSDIIQSLVVAPGFTMIQNVTIQSEFMCLLTYICPSFVSLGVSGYMLVCIAIERYIAIAKPLHYTQIVTNKRVKIALILTTIHASLVGSLPLLGWNNIRLRPTNGPRAWSPKFCVPFLVMRGSYSAFVFIGNTCPLVLAVIFIYGKIYAAARRQAKAMKSLSVGTGTVRNGNVTTRRKKGIFVLLLMVIVSVASWSPILFLYTYEFHWYAIEVVYEPRAPEFAHLFAIGVVFGNTAVNPYLYGLANKEVRKTIFRMFLGCRKSREIHPERMGGGSTESETWQNRTAIVVN